MQECLALSAILDEFLSNKATSSIVKSYMTPCIYIPAIRYFKRPGNHFASKRLGYFSSEKLAVQFTLLHSLENKYIGLNSNDNFTMDITGNPIIGERKINADEILTLRHLKRFETNLWQVDIKCQEMDIPII